jgi:ankyrin repeat protein
VYDADLEALRAMVKSTPAPHPDLNRRDETGFTPLMTAASFTSETDSKEICMLLLNAGALATTCGRDNGMSALHWAAYMGNAAALRLLIKRGGLPVDMLTAVHGDTCVLALRATIVLFARRSRARSSAQREASLRVDGESALAHLAPSSPPAARVAVVTPSLPQTAALRGAHGTGEVHHAAR